MYLHDLAHAVDARNWHNIADQIETELFVERRVDRGIRTDYEQRVSVRGGTHNRISADIAPCARPVFNNKWLRESLGKPLTYESRENVDCLSGGKSDNHTHRLRRI